MGARMRPPTVDEINSDWEEFAGGAPVVGLLGNYEPSGVEGLLVTDEATGDYGLVTWAVRGETAEIVSLQAEPPGVGTGARLMAAAEEELRRRRVRRVLLATTNDNVKARQASHV